MVSREAASWTGEPPPESEWGSGALGGSPAPAPQAESSVPSPTCEGQPARLNSVLVLCQRRRRRLPPGLAARVCLQGAARSSAAPPLERDGFGWGFLSFGLPLYKGERAGSLHGHSSF